MSAPTKTKADVRRPDLETLYCINEDGSHNTIHPADVKGRFQNLKKTTWAFLIAIYVVLPWIKVGGHPAILVDLPNRHFFLFGKIFNAADFWLFFFVLSGVGLFLFFLSATYGRVWCGYGCPQTVFLEGVYRRIERWIEGGATARDRLAKMPWNREKIIKRFSKLGIYLLIALFLSHTFLSYFIPVEVLLKAVTSSPAAHPAAFTFILIFTAIIFGNFTWFREQLCLIVCPYGRLQSALYDPDTIVVGYDRRRGEPRGRYNKEGEHGDCIDCYRCVAVCPTGIDIRNGTQMECVGCANCIDACDVVMDKVKKPRGLIRYDSENGFEGKKTRILRPRTILYMGIMALWLGGFLYAVMGHAPFDAELIRLRSDTLFTIEKGKIRNQFRLQLTNKTGSKQKFEIRTLSPKTAEFILAEKAPELDSLESRNIPVFVFVPEKDYKQGTLVRLEIHSKAGTRVVKAPFLGPRK
ncbi:MAG TPA: cytochrome c oxidase accessory protein CcoG [Planctomycetes bacterium]|nr:cytochrome c oxidase accessory protein CcoG [Planctomycetota bacterium]